MVKTPEIHSSPTETRILEAAKTVFIENGLDGTSMQQIADKASINKSLLHYYFRNKEKLFNAVFSYAFRQFIPQIQEILDSGASIFVKIEKIVSEYMGMLMKNKFIPAFVLHEINRNPDRLFGIMQDSGIDPNIIVNQFVAEIAKGNIRPIDPRHLIVNILSLCIFPIAARPLIQRILYSNDSAAYQQFLEERKKIVTEFIIHAIQV
jgi:TetR/AcrR family transcriptional regulator